MRAPPGEEFAVAGSDPAAGKARLAGTEDTIAALVRAPSAARRGAPQVGRAAQQAGPVRLFRPPNTRQGPDRVGPPPGVGSSYDSRACINPQSVAGNIPSR